MDGVEVFYWRVRGGSSHGPPALIYGLLPWLEHQSTIRPENLEVWSSYTSLRSQLHLFFPVSETAITQTGLNKCLTKIKVTIFYTIEKWLWNLQHCSYSPFYLPLPDNWY